tara:strand:+ start:1189 stop:1512 length:324 start_codon:yes stop_codon:yes gene_type:complete
MEQSVIDLIHSDELTNLKLAGVLVGVDVVLNYILENIGKNENSYGRGDTSLTRIGICNIGLIYAEFGYSEFNKPWSYWQIKIKNHSLGMGVDKKEEFKIKFKKLLTE